MLKKSLASTRGARTERCQYIIKRARPVGDKAMKQKLRDQEPTDTLTYSLSDGEFLMVTDALKEQL